MDANKAYWELRSGKVDPYGLAPLTRWIKPWPQWNPIWMHRAIIECCRYSWDENKAVSVGEWADHLRATRKKLASQWDTTLFGRGNSNKSFTHYLTLCCLDAAVGDANLEPYQKLIAIYQEMAPDGCWREGIHYGLFCYDAIFRAWDLLNGVWPIHQRGALIRCFLAHQEWLAVTKNHEGVWPAVGDGWPESEVDLWIDIPTPRKFNAGEPITIEYEDMTVHRNKDWVVIHNHRWSGPCYHEHCEGDGILVSYKGEWVLPGDGCPTWFRKVLAPWKWDRPKNHWGSLRSEEWPVFWRLFRRELGWRTVELLRNGVIITDVLGEDVQWPTQNVPGIEFGMRLGVSHISNREFADWKCGPLGFHVEAAAGIEAKVSHANVTTGYKKSKRVSAVRVRGQHMVTNVWAMDSPEASGQFDPDGWLASSS